MPRFRKRPVEITAMQITDDLSLARICGWAAAYGVHPIITGSARPFGLTIPTLEGDMYGAPGDWVIQGAQGEFYPCKPDIFEKTYEPSEELSERQTAS